MRKIFKKEELKGIGIYEYPKEILSVIEEILLILDENYGTERKIQADLGGYVLIAENIVDIEILKQDKLEGLVPEYTDIIECSEGVNWTSSLFLLSSDFSIVVVCTEELSKFLLE